MSVLGSYEVHKSDHSFNQKVVDAIAMAKLTKNSRDYIDCITGGKSISDIRNAKETERLEVRKQNLGMEDELER